MGKFLSEVVESHAEEFETEAASLGIAMDLCIYKWDGIILG